MTTPSIDNELLRMTAELHTGELSDADFAAMQERLRDDPEARALYLELTRHEAALFAVHAAPLDTLTPPTAHPIDDTPVRMKISPAVYGVAAALLVAAAGLAIYLIAAQPGEAPPAPPARPMIATLVDLSEGTLLVDDDVANPGDAYAAGDFRIDRGAAELQLASGASVEMHGRTHLRIDTSMRATLLDGQAAFQCPPGAVGYTVALPRGVKVVDLGTRFEIEVGPDGDARVSVTEGRVRIDSVNGKSQWIVGSEAIVRDGRVFSVDTVAFNAESNRSERGDDPPGLAGQFEHTKLVVETESILAAFGAHVGTEPGAVMMFDHGVADNGNDVIGDADETVDVISWRMKRPVLVAGYRVRLSTDGGETAGPRSLQVMRLIVNGQPVDTFDADGPHGEVVRVFAGGPVSGDRFRFEFTRTTNGESNAGPRIVEIDAITPVAPGAVVGAPPEYAPDPPIGSVDPTP